MELQCSIICLQYVDNVFILSLYLAGLVEYGPHEAVQVDHEAGPTRARG